MTQAGIIVPHFGHNVSAEAIRDVAQAAEELGYDSVWTADHIAFPATFRSRYPFADDGQLPIAGDEVYFDIFPTLGYLAGVVSRVRLGVGVCIVPYRNPVVLAKLIATVDQLSAGRFIFGAGVGWLEEEFDALGANFADRGRLTDETLAFLQHAFTTRGPITFAGEFIRVDDMLIEPRLYAGRSPDVWVGGVANRALRRTGRFGSTWFPHLHGADPRLIEDRVRTIDATRAEHDREGPTAVALFMPIELTDRSVEDPSPIWERRFLRGTEAEVLEAISFYESLGVSHFALSFGGGPDRRIRTMRRLVDAGLLAT